ncbi:hypothetical protein CH252_41480 [Rhodococcus sp. 06-1477-1B]|nr:hypothetical protein CH252_41480 [Rhodococcus sp. 06-1477-1B]
MIRRRRLTFGAVAALLVGLVALAVIPLVSLTAAWNTEARREAIDLSSFDPGHLIDDEQFYDGDALTADEIQNFLDDQVGECGNDSCLSVLRSELPARGPLVSDATGRTICEGYDGGELTAAQIIDRVQRACRGWARCPVRWIRRRRSAPTSTRRREDRFRSSARRGRRYRP